MTKPYQSQLMTFLEYREYGSLTMAVAAEHIIAVTRNGPNACTLHMTSGKTFVLENDYECVVACIEGARA